MKSRNICTANRSPIQYSHMELQIIKLDPNIPTPKYETDGAIAFDIAAKTQTHINPQEIVYVKTGLVIKTPKDHGLLLAARSSNIKKGLMLPNGIGVIDQDYCGPDDEIMVPLWNYTSTPYTIDKHERIAQAIITPIAKPAINIATETKSQNRGGFGTTG